MHGTQAEFESVKIQLAEICEREMGMPRDKVLAGTPFLELDKHFDSLSLVQVQLCLEELYGIEFDLSAFTLTEGQQLPANVDEFTALFLPQLIELTEAKKACQP